MQGLRHRLTERPRRLVEQGAHGGGVTDHVGVASFADEPADRARRHSGGTLDGGCDAGDHAAGQVNLGRVRSAQMLGGQVQHLVDGEYVVAADIEVPPERARVTQQRNELAG